MKLLVTEKIQKEDATITEDTSGTARLLMKVMSKKLNEKYNGILNEQQKSLIKAYAYSTSSDDQTSIRLKLQEIKSELVSLIDGYESEVQNDYLKNKLEETKSTLLGESLELVDDETVTRFMLYSKLRDELETKE
jgi:ribosomal protein S17E